LIAVLEYEPKVDLLPYISSPPWPRADACFKQSDLPHAFLLDYASRSSFSSWIFSYQKLTSLLYLPIRRMPCSRRCARTKNISQASPCQLPISHHVASLQPHRVLLGRYPVVLGTTSYHSVPRYQHRTQTNTTCPRNRKSTLPNLKHPDPTKKHPSQDPGPTQTAPSHLASRPHLPRQPLHTITALTQPQPYQHHHPSSTPPSSPPQPPPSPQPAATSRPNPAFGTIPPPASNAHCSTYHATLTTPPAPAAHGGSSALLLPRAWRNHFQ